MKGVDPSVTCKEPALVKHATGVVKTVGVAISLLNDLEKLVPILKDLVRNRDLNPRCAPCLL